MLGECLCGKISFEIDRENLKIYLCHCSLCRRQSGSYSNAATIIENEKMRFLSGEEHIKSWVKESGFRSDFCGCCGSPVPNPLRNTGFHWVPTGLLETSGSSSKVIFRVCLNSKVSWAPIGVDTEDYEELPSLDYLIATLSSEES
jgi:hypothetical protein